MRRTLVLDTSAVIAGLTPGLVNAEQATVSGVLEEARDLCRKLELETSVLTGKIKILEPSKSSLDKVREKAKQSGDVVSETDVRLLALALDLGGEGELVTDDYAIQNLASMFNVPFRRIAMPGIKEVLRWEAVCSACGRRYPSSTNHCLTCGSSLKRRPRR